MSVVKEDMKLLSCKRLLRGNKVHHSILYKLYYLMDFHEVGFGLVHAVVVLEPDTSVSGLSSVVLRRVLS